MKIKPILPTYCPPRQPKLLIEKGLSAMTSCLRSKRSRVRIAPGVPGSPSSHLSNQRLIALSARLPVYYELAAGRVFWGHFDWRFDQWRGRRG